MSFDALGRTQRTIAEELASALFSSLLPQSLLFSGKPGSSRLTGALDLAYELTGGNRNVLRLPETALFLSRQMTNEFSSAISLFERHRNESSKMFLIETVRKILLQYHYSIAELYEGKKAAVKGSGTDSDGKGDSTLFGNAEAVDSIILDMEDRTEWDDESVSEVVSELRRRVTPDFMTLGKKSAGATIDEIRAIQNWLEDGSTEKCVIFENAEDYTEGAKNSMLKMLEEPPEHSHIILISEYPSRLLQTILSRVRRFSFPELSRKSISSFIGERYMLYGDYPSFAAFFFETGNSDEDRKTVHDAAALYSSCLIEGKMMERSDENRMFQDLERLSAYPYFLSLVKSYLDEALSSGVKISRVRNAWNHLSFYISRNEIFNMNIRYALDLALREVADGK